MNKNDLVSAVAGHAHLSKVHAGRAVDALFASIEAALTSGDEVRIVGFGSSVAHRAASTGRNPRTGEAIQTLHQSSLSSRPVPHLKLQLTIKF